MIRKKGMKVRNVSVVLAGVFLVLGLATIVIGQQAIPVGHPFDQSLCGPCHANLGTFPSTPHLAVTANCADCHGLTTSTVTITAPIKTAVEGAKPGRFRITRKGGDLTQPLVVNYSITGTATNGQDYLRKSGKATIRANKTSVIITVPAKADGIAEAAETVIFSLSQDPSYATGSKSSAKVTIPAN